MKKLQEGRSAASQTDPGREDPFRAILREKKMGKKVFSSEKGVSNAPQEKLDEPTKKKNGEGYAAGKYNKRRGGRKREKVGPPWFEGKGSRSGAFGKEAEKKKKKEGGKGGGIEDRLPGEPIVGLGKKERPGKPRLGEREVLGKGGEGPPALGRDGLSCLAGGTRVKGKMDPTEGTREKERSWASERSGAPGGKTPCLRTSGKKSRRERTGGKN